MNRPITLLYSCSWGEAMRCAHLMAGRLAREGHHVLAADIGRYLASHLLADQVVLICLSGREESGDAVVDFLDYVQSLESGDLEGLRFSVLSLSDRQRTHAMGTELDFLLKHLEATRIVAHMVCPAECRRGFAIWSDAVSEILAFDRALRLSPVPLEL